MTKFYKRSYCVECEDLVEFSVEGKDISEVFHGTKIKYKFSVGVCKECGGEVPTDISYSQRKSIEKVRAYNAISNKPLM